MVGKEGLIIRKTLPVFFYYALLSGTLGYAIVHFRSAGLVNAGSIAFLIIITVLLMWAMRTLRHSTAAADRPES